MTDVTLSAAVRSSLLSLQKTTELVDRTQNRLSTGLKVAGAIDDPVSFFQAKSLSDRAADFTQRKDGIDQGISSVTAALDAVEGIESIAQQLKGLAQSLKSSTGTQFTDLITQFNNLRSQIANLTTDATYQGTNLVNATGQTLTIEFSEKTASLLTINSVDLTQTGLGVNAVARYSGGDSIVEVNNASRATVSFTSNSANTGGITGLYFTFTYRGPDETFGTANTYQLTYGTQTLTIAAGTNAQSITQGRVVALAVASAAALGSTAIGTGATFALSSLAIVNTAIVTGTAVTATLSTAFFSSTQNSTNYVSETDTTQINEMISEIDSALTTLRANASTLGSNVALLSTRLEFTKEYVNTLETGASKLTLADINEEGANLLALQTRQQLGISALSFAGQAEQSILALFR